MEINYGAARCLACSYLLFPCTCYAEEIPTTVIGIDCSGCENFHDRTGLNLYDSLGEICVHCGCCSKDPLVRTQAIIDALQRYIAHFESFDGWSDDLLVRATQKMNIEKNLKPFRRQLRYYQKRLKELENE